jgi:hypothetical protein
MSAHRNRPGISGPLILIFLGVVFLLNNLGVTDWTVWDVILRFWPVLLIAAGLDLVIGRRSAWGSVAALVIILAIIGLSLGTFRHPPEAFSGPLQVGVPVGSADRAQIRLSPAVGYLRLQAGTPTGDDVLHGQVRPFRGERIGQSSRPMGSQVEVQVESASWVVVPFITMNFDRPNWDLTVSRSTPLDLETSLSVGKTEIDLTGAQLDELRAETSLGQTVIKLPAAAATVDVEGGIGEIVLTLPVGIGVKIQASTGIGSVDVPAGYSQRGGVYYSPNFESADAVIEITVDLGIGVVHVR